MIPSKKRTANLRNSTLSTGPKTRVGKRHSARNAVKHGFFSRELSLDDKERPEFEALRRALCEQFAPTTSLKQIAFERIVCSCWRCKLAIRVEMERLRVHFSHKECVETGDGALVKLPSQFYGIGSGELRVAKRFLEQLREDMESSGFLHVEELKDSITKTYGQECYDSLMQWKPMASIDDVRLAAALSEKNKRFGMDHPPQLDDALKNIQVMADPQLMLQMAIKLVEGKMQHLEDLARQRKEQDSGTERGGGDVVEGLMRYFTAATRELERAVRWYQELDQQGW
jgi:hypothetical protein